MIFFILFFAKPYDHKFLIKLPLSGFLIIVMGFFKTEQQNDCFYDNYCPMT